MVGGALEYVALITGYRFLLILIGVLYGLAFVTSRLLTRRQAGSPAGSGVQVTAGVR
jgi:hypothetical protein